MKKNKLIAGGLTLAALAAAIFLGKDQLAMHFPQLGMMLQTGTSGQYQSAEIDARQAESLQIAEATLAAAEALAAETPAPEIAAVPPATGASPAEVKPWTLHANDSGVAPSLSLSPKIKVYSPVTLEPHPDRLPVEGEQIMLPMFNGKSVKVNVETTQSNANGDYIWSGHLDGYDNSYPVVMTYGENTTFATITTPDGSYSLEAVKGVGWLYKNPAEAELSAQGKNDYLIPEIH